MMNQVERYMSYIASQKRYSSRTRAIYSSVLESFYRFTFDSPELCVAELGDDVAIDALRTASIRSYQIYLMDDRGNSPVTVNLHLSVLSGYCRFLMKQGVLTSNPVGTLARPKCPKRLPSFFRADAMDFYLRQDNALSRRDFELELETEDERRETYWLCLRRVLVSTLYCTGMRRAELIALDMEDLDTVRSVLHVRGKGDKMREIPLTAGVIEEISLYLQSVRRLVHCNMREAAGPLFLTYSGRRLYPVIVDRAVKAELGNMGSEFAGRKSPHVLRHSFATGLMEEGADLNSIKEVLGHSNLAATQVYTHSSIKALKKIYEQAHPRATVKGAKNGN